MESKIIFQHIPKTAGTTFNDILDREYGRKNILSLSPQDSRKVLAGKEKLSGSYKVYRGHMNFGLHDFIDEPCRYVIFLRDPVKRAISFYHYIWDNPKHYLHQHFVDTEMTMLKFFSSSLTTEIEDGQSRMILGVSGEKLPLAEKDVHAVRERIMSYATLCLTEEFDRSLVMLHRQLGWSKLPLYHSKNVSIKKKPPVPEGVIEIIAERNNVDILVYEWAKSFFATQYAAEIDSPQVALEQFVRANEQYVPSTTGLDLIGWTKRAIVKTQSFFKK